ncbi:MAG: hypothetical protein OXC29_22435 [Rhodococcus sp.]|nr:hypothetical protein [Rhodococcus sp. (in: high G+C Gram-positive bacteria)]
MTDLLDPPLGDDLDDSMDAQHDHEVCEFYRKHRAVWGCDCGLSDNGDPQ